MAGTLVTGGDLVSGTTDFFESYDAIRVAAGSDEAVSLRITGGAGPLDLSEELGLVGASIRFAASVDVTIALTTGQGSDRVAGSGAADRVLASGGLDTLLGGIGQDSLLGQGGGDLLVGDAGADALFGGRGADSLFGGAGADELDGGSGNDTLSDALGSNHFAGGAGDDVYRTDGGVGASDFDERPGGGRDHLFVDARSGGTLSRLGAGIEDLTTSGAGGRAFGNSLDNRIAGHGGFRLFGEGGDDRMSSGRGGDILDGGTGDDTLDSRGDQSSRAVIGGRGDDLFLVDRGDRVVEKAGQGIDEVRVAADYTLGAGIENLVLLGGATSGTGNFGDNRLTGNGRDNRLDGFKGDDTLFGGSGNDLLLSDLGNDAAYGGRGSDALDGASGTDRLFGGQGRDALSGSLGTDLLTGGRGNDAFVFANIGSAHDRIRDFHDAQGDNDVFLISVTGFGGGLSQARGLSGAQFDAQGSNVAQSATVRFIFETDSERVWFDPDGAGGSGPRLVADLQDGAEVTARDFLLV